MRLLFTTVGLSGHYFPLVPLAWAARALGHEVLVSTSDSFGSAVLRSGLPFASCGTAAKPELVDIRGAGGVEECRRANGRTFGATAANGLRTMLSIVDTWRPDVVISERAEFAGPIAAATHGVPTVEVHWGVAALPEYRAAATLELDTELDQLGLTTLPTPDRVLNPWPPSLLHPYATRHHPLRHVSYNGDATVPAWTRHPRRKPRICVTLGTVLPNLGDVAQAVHAQLTALAALDVDIVVAVDEAVAATWPTLPAAVHHVGRLPLAQVLRACDLTIHHGGQGTTLTALDAGIPQVILPAFDDQLDNAEAVTRAGAGIRLHPGRTTPDALAATCADVLADPQFAHQATRTAAEIARQPSPVEAATALNTLMTQRQAA